jgi:hypothetical protein
MADLSEAKWTATYKLLEQLDRFRLAGDLSIQRRSRCYGFQNNDWVSR